MHKVKRTRKELERFYYMVDMDSDSEFFEQLVVYDKKGLTLAKKWQKEGLVKEIDIDLPDAAFNLTDKGWKLLDEAAEKFG